MRKVAWKLMTGAALLATPFTAQAQTAQASGEGQSAEAASDAGTNDIIVTARRTNERLQDVPVAVTAFGSDALAARNVDTLDQVARFTPNIRFDGAAALSGGNYNATVFIRGVGQNDFAIFSDPGVGFYVDDVYYARSIGGVMDAVDIASVQVLRGPQGTLFGKNTIGGAMVITTARPKLDVFEGKLEATYGSFDRIDVKGAVNIPLVEGKVALRLSGATLNRDGYVKRLYDGGTQGNRNAQMVRGTLRLAPTDTLTIDIGGDYTRARENSAPSDLLAVANVPGITGTPFLTNYNRFVAPTLGITAPNGQNTLNASYITASPFETWAGGPNRNDLDLWGTQGTVALELGQVTLKSITAYRDMKAYFTRDGDNTPFTFRQTTNRDKQWQFSQELQASGKVLDDKLSFVVGGYYFKEKGSDIATADLAIGLWPPLADPALFAGGVHPELHQQPQHRVLRSGGLRDRPPPVGHGRRALHLGQEGLHLDQRAPARQREVRGRDQGSHVQQVHAALRPELQGHRRHPALRLVLARVQAGRVQRPSARQRGGSDPVCAGNARYL
jgi:iron complex outermembrane receptor protein